jgi:hypothetical protein
MDSTRLYLTADDLRSVSNIAEALFNLTYLISEDAEHPNKVRQYASLSEDLLRALTELLKEKRD